ncbi:MAG: hypothetical protein K8S99_02130 [Planctomycetes bacterium]|nr:hypothetical protein [Planctomycetota bacterium]
MKTIPIRADYYQQFGADYTRDVPGEGYGGWKSADIEISAERTAVVVMHAWDVRPMAQDPAGYNECEYLPRADAICKTVFPKLLSAIRVSGFKLFHVVGRGGYYEHLPGFQRAVALAGPAPAGQPRVENDPVRSKLDRFRYENVWPGRPNIASYERSWAGTRFHPAAQPHGEEGIAADAHQLTALCRDAGVNHLIYAGFAIGACLLISPGGMVDMQRRGVMCSVLREAVTAVENKETARRETTKEVELWRVALNFGFVFGVEEFITAIGRRPGDNP